MIRKLFWILLSLMIVVGSCDSPAKEEGDEGEDITNSEEPLVITDGQIEKIIQSFSSPVEMAALIKDAGAQFSKEILMPTNNADAYDSNFKRAVGLGMLGVDLGYINIYQKTSLVVNHITISKKLADEMSVGQFLEFETIKNLAMSNENVDSLIFVSTNSFNRMDDYLREKGRNHLSTLIITGVWIEGLYLATQVVKQSPNPRIAERIGEQKIILSDIILLLKNYESDKNFAALISDLEEIKDEFKPVRITYEIGEPESVEENGKLRIIQKSTSVVDITAEQLKRIIAKTEQIRNKLIGLT